MTLFIYTNNLIIYIQRLRRRHRLLIAIALVFYITWLPLNVLNLLIDIQNPFKHPNDEEKMIIIYAVCHLFGMSSACSNLFLYGWFNGNFRKSSPRYWGLLYELYAAGTSFLIIIQQKQLVLCFPLPFE